MNRPSAKSSVRAVRIVGTGSYVPDNVLTNADVEKIVDTSDEWIVTRTGIRERRIAPPGDGRDRSGPSRRAKGAGGCRTHAAGPGRDHRRDGHARPGVPVRRVHLQARAGGEPGMGFRPERRLLRIPLLALRGAGDGCLRPVRYDSHRRSGAPFPLDELGRSDDLHLAGGRRGRGDSPDRATRIIESSR